VNQIVQQEIDKGVKPARIVIAGFSQGGAVAFHAALRSPHALGGVVALSTWVPLRADYPAAFSPAAAHLPILQVKKITFKFLSTSCFVFCMY
jgi:predicted esterase